MFKTFFYDLTYLPRFKFNAKYTMPLLIALLVYGLVGQIIMMLIPLGQLNKVSGHVVNMETKIRSWSHIRYTTRSTPNYALIITLDNTWSYDIQADSARAKLGETLKNGDYVTIYYPTLAEKIISSGLARNVSQVERNKEILYSWKQQQIDSWVLIPLFIFFIAFFYWFRGYLRDYVETPKFI